MPRGRTLQPEHRISHYRVVGPLGSGGMGEVYLAEDETLEREVALKVLPPELVRSEDRVRRFVQEAKSASSLNHPNIITIYEIGQDSVRAASGETEPDSGPVQFISMELIRGKTLGAKIHDEKEDLRTLLGYAAQAAEGVAKAHAAGIIHRDLKPGNIMVSDDGFAKVLDFGLAKLTEKRSVEVESSTAPTEVNTSRGAVLGTVGYMSPEQVQGKTLDHRSDIFSFGCILYEIATRRRPFVADSDVETMHKILLDRPTPVEEVNAAVPAEVRRLVRRCLAKSPDQRLQSMKDVALELREIVDEFETLSASSSSGIHPALPAPPRKRALWLPVAAVVALVAIGLVGWWLLRQRGGRAEEPFQSMRLTTQTNRGDVQFAAISPDGRYLAYLSRAGGHFTMRVRQVATGSDVEILAAQDQEVRNPSFTPDGNYVLYTMRKVDAPAYFTLFQVPSLGGPPREVAFDVDSRASFSPDGKQVSFIRGEPQNRRSVIVVRNLESSEERVLAALAVPSQPIAPDWSPDGRRIAVAVTPPNNRTAIMLYDARSGRGDELIGFERTFVTDLAWLRDGSGLAVTRIDLNAGRAEQISLVSYPGGRLRRVTNDANSYGSLSLSSGDVAIAAVRRSTLANLWAVDLGGTEPRRITSVTSPEDSPGPYVVTSDEHVAHLAFRDGKPVCLVQPFAGGEPRPIDLRNAFPNSLISSGGTTILSVSIDNQLSIWRAQADGSGARQLSDRSNEVAVHISPDGKRISIAKADSTRGASIVSTETGQIERTFPDAYLGLAFFAPDNRRVDVPILEPDSRGLIRGIHRIFSLEDGRLLARVIPPPTASAPIEGQIGWSPVTDALSYIDGANPGNNVFNLPLDSSATYQVTRFSEGRTKSITWSPDGAFLAVVRTVGGADNVWVVGRRGESPRQLTRFTTEQIFFPPRWTPDSRRLVVNAGSSSQDAVLIRDFR